MPDPTWGSAVYAYYGIIPYWEEYPERKTRHGGGGL
jgi:hypothetical protein